MSSDEKSIEQRIVLLERFAEAVTIRQTGEDQLAEGVVRLSDETSALNAILTKVDEQQQHLARLDVRTDLVEETAVSREELIHAAEAQEEEAREFRKQTLKRIYFIGWFITMVLLISGYGFYEYNKHESREHFRACTERNEQYDILLDILNGVVADLPDESPRAISIRNGIQRLEDQLIDCEVYS